MELVARFATQATENSRDVQLLETMLYLDPESSEVDPRIMSASASIRYTANKDWLVLKWAFFAEEWVRSIF